MGAIVIDHLSYAYPRGQTVLHNLNVTIPQGAFAVITGVEGAGKTTLCLAMTGAVPGYFGGRMAGTVTVDGLNAAQVAVADLAEKVGIVLADYDSQLVALTVAEEVAFGLENRGASPEQIAHLSREALAMVGLSGKESKEVSSLSGGQRQRLAIASMLVTKPDILVLDEPASALDPEGSAELYGLLNDLNKNHGKTIVVVEHNLADVLPYADLLIVMEAGQMVICGKPQAALASMIEQGVYVEAVPERFRQELEAGKKAIQEAVKSA